MTPSFASPHEPGHIVVTGAAGFIGSHLSELLVRRGHAVTGVDDFTPFYDRERKESHLARLVAEPRFDLHEADVAAPGLVARCAGARAVVHLAGRPGVRGGTPAEFAHANVETTRAVLAAAAGGGVRRVVLASSSSVYAPAAGPVDEQAPHGPPSEYGRSKARAEAVAGALAARYGLELVILRLFTVYGPRQRPDMAFARYIESALSGDPMPLFGDGAQVRDFTYVGDAAAAIEAALARGRPGAAYNVAGGRPTTLRAALGVLSATLGHPAALAAAPRDPREHRRTGAVLTRARHELGWRPAVGLEEGLRRQTAHALGGVPAVPGVRQPAAAPASA